MKRARIKAMVTVPTRRKAAQDTCVNENVNSVQQNEKNKTVSDNICTIPQHNIENTTQEKQIQENLKAEEQVVQHVQSHTNHPILENNDKPIQSPEEQKKETIEVPDNISIPQVSSPIKQNRGSFMKPTPKFDSGSRIRRNSVQGNGASTSESEDDSRRVSSSVTNSTKNDTVQSTQSIKDTITSNIKNNLTTSKVGQKRRILVSESARKLAEARREFHLKHENKTPDRAKLTMYDLIYYNPVTNPMKKSKESGIVARKMSECQSEDLQEEENEDDPSSAMPVPQVKVGPNGQLIIDEQSLVIEQTNAKKSREALAKEAIVDDDNSGSGFYKRRKKSKEWSTSETIKFYKALNTVGTDFLLMQSLFPNRTRQEIKLKFKKEEKVNRNLVEKTLVFHQEFNTELLEKSLAVDENSEKEHSDNQEKQKQQKTKNTKVTKASKKRKNRLVVTAIEQRGESDEEEEERSKGSNFDLMVYDEYIKINNEHQQKLNKTNKKMQKRPREDEDQSLVETDDVTSLSSFNDADSDTEVYRVRPTRSGRLPKVKKLQGPDINTLDNERLNYSPDDHEMVVPSGDNADDSKNLIFNSDDIEAETHQTDSLKTVIPNIGDVEPGSLVILSKESPEEPGKSVLQVYMVSSDVNSQDLEKSNITPVNISPELLATVTAKISDVESVPLKEECE